MYVCSFFPYLVLCIDVGPSVDEQSHHLRVTVLRSCYQGSPPILMETHRDTTHHSPLILIETNIYTVVYGCF